MSAHWLYTPRRRPTSSRKRIDLWAKQFRPIPLPIRNGRGRLYFPRRSFQNRQGTWNQVSWDTFFTRQAGGAVEAPTGSPGARSAAASTVAVSARRVERTIMNIPLFLSSTRSGDRTRPCPSVWAVSPTRPAAHYGRRGAATRGSCCHPGVRRRRRRTKYRSGRAQPRLASGARARLDHCFVDAFGIGGEVLHEHGGQPARLAVEVRRIAPRAARVE